ncbi:VOC family protein [Marinimicrobium sp. C2-29]|uniref:VOC family protein n=1 Tax=Marinimicrobium sp. C2-29 TaxID=3139825 RepID=UPI003139BEBF
MPNKHSKFIRHNRVVGAIMPKPEDMPQPMWQYYFRCANIDIACKTITDKGGEILLGPEETPGEEYMVKGLDPQGAMFSLVGARK